MKKPRREQSLPLGKRIKEILAERPKVSLSDPNLKRAAVLIPIFQKDNEYYILLTKRTEQVSHHKGQISFPGGSQDPGEDPLTTALREAQEELGLLKEDILILGELDDMFTVSSDFLISPFVGLIPNPYAYKINGQEIAEIIEIPFSALSDSKNWRQKFIERDRSPLLVYFFRYQDYPIWGATARILKQLVELIFGNKNQ